ncbi:hypothetical protein ACHAP7_009539 [Fusarium lateritium]
MSNTATTRRTIAKLISTDPGLPRTNPTTPYWFRDSHPLASTQSSSLPTERDVVIIGCGITAVSVAQALLEQSPDCRVSIIEARTLCSGATGRNGGHLVAYGAVMYSKLKSMYGKDMATATVTFTLKNVERTRQLIKDHSTNEEYRDVLRLRAFRDEGEFRKAQQSISEFEQDNPSMAGLYKFADREEAQKEHGVHGVAGIVIFKAGALWPYRLIMTILKAMMEKFPSRLTLEANTPALSISDDSSASSTHSYVVTTPRGQIRASHVVHCTNGYSGHLLPKLRGALFPFRGTMTVQDLGNCLPNRGATHSWSVHSPPRLDKKLGLVDSGMRYLQQNAHSGHFFFGGEKATASDTLTADDSVENPTSAKSLKQQLPQLFGLSPVSEGQIVSQWTGVMGYTADGWPVVGQLPETMTGRKGAGEWIAAGFNGMGMSMCVLSGESLAKMILGQEASDLPDTFKITSSRLRDHLTVEKSATYMADIFCPPQAKL